MKLGFQAGWKDNVTDVYKKAEFPREWHKILFDYAKEKGVIWFSAPYDKEAADIMSDLGAELYKIGSGDISWLEMLKYIAKKNRPILIGTGASTLAEVDEAVKVIREEGNDQIILLQCVTNYPSKFENANIEVVRSYQKAFNTLVGYSDHTPGHVVPLGAVTLGCCIIEKHFTDDRTREGPDHPHAMNPKEFKEMVDNIRLLEKALGSPVKDIYPEERETVILQRRCLRVNKYMKKGDQIKEEDINILRPAPKDSIYPKYKEFIIGKILKEDITKGNHIKWKNV